MIFSLIFLKPNALYSKFTYRLVVLIILKSFLSYQRLTFLPQRRNLEVSCHSITKYCESDNGEMWFFIRVDVLVQVYSRYKYNVLRNLNRSYYRFFVLPCHYKSFIKQFFFLIFFASIFFFFSFK